LLLAADLGKWPIQGDAAKLRQVFTNILDNAIKFTLAGGRVTVSAATTEDRLIVRVQDDGCGMRAEDIGMVTRPFHRLRHAFDGQYQGAGLGLPYANAIVKLHGGSLSIESEMGIGTTVEITLPLYRDAMGIAA